MDLTTTRERLESEQHICIVRRLKGGMIPSPGGVFTPRKDGAASSSGDPVVLPRSTPLVLQWCDHCWNLEEKPILSCLEQGCSKQVCLQCCGAVSSYCRVHDSDHVEPRPFSLPIPPTVPFSETTPSVSSDSRHSRGASPRGLEGLGVDIEIERELGHGSFSRVLLGHSRAMS